MKKFSLLFLGILFLLQSISYAQPANDDCSGAIVLTSLTNWCSSNGVYTNVASTQTLSTLPSCWTGSIPNNDVWFQFTAIGDAINISVDGTNGGGTLAKPQIVVFSGTCSPFTMTQIGCSQFTTSNTGFASLYISGLNIGQTYYIVIDGYNTNTGTFKLCINNFNAPVAPGQDCGTAAWLCNKNTITQQLLNGYGSFETSGTCLDNSDKNTVWYKWTAADNGTINFSITPLIPADDFDWVLFDLGTSGACTSLSTKDLSCNASSCYSSSYNGATGINSTSTQAGNPGHGSGCNSFPEDPQTELWNQQYNQVAGKIYGLLINNWTDASVGLDNGFTLNFGGTGTFVGPHSNYTIAPSSPYCIGDIITFTSSSTGSPTTYSWDFGSGASIATASTAGPHNISYYTAGSKTIILTVGNGSCEDVYYQTIIVGAATPPTYTKTSANSTSCTSPNGTITISPTSTGVTYNWITGPIISPIPAGNKPGGATDERALINLAAGTYCVNITSPSVAGGVTTTTLFTEDFEAATPPWTINNSSGANQFIINNIYTGGFCSSALGTFTVNDIPNQNSAITGAVKSKYLHIIATTTNPITCSTSSSPFPPLNSNYNGSDNAPNQYATYNSTINTTSYTNIKLSYYWMGNGRAEDYAIIQYSVNGGTTWLDATAHLWNQSTWLQSNVILPSTCENIANLKIRVKWVNNSSGSTDPPICIDQIVITGDQVSSATCGVTVQECFTISGPTNPTISGTLTACSGSATQLTGSGTPAASNAWTSSNTSVATINSTGLVTGVTAGNTTITYTDNGGCSTTASVTITSCGCANPTTLNIPVTSGSTCANSAIIISNNTFGGSATQVTVSASANASGSITSGTTYTSSPFSFTYTPVLADSNKTINFTITTNNPLGSPCAASSSTYSLSINNPLYIVNNPTNLTQCAGTNASFSVTASGTATLNYQWQKGGVNISGANSSTLSLSNISSTDVGNYTCVVTNSCGSATSNAATLTITLGPSITTQPTALTKCPTENGTFSVVVSGGSATYQWQFNGTNISGATSSALTLNNISATDEGDYVCVVSSTCGSVNSNSASLTVNTLPSVTTHPVAVTQCAGTNTSFSVTASGTVTLNYQWQKDGLNITGETSSTLSLLNISSTNAGSYTCVVTNSCGSATSNAATLTITPGPSITTQPTALTKCPTDNGSFSVVVSGGSATYQWQFNGANISGATSSTLTLNNISSTDAGNYICVVSSTCGNVNSNSALLTVNSLPSVTTHPVDVTQCSGTNASFSVTASGTATLNYQWQKDGVNISGGTTSTLTLSNISSTNSGSYTCIVTNSCGSATSNAAILTITPGPSITTHPTALTKCPGDNGSFSVVVSGCSATYQWQLNGANISGAISSTLSINNISATNAGNYICVVSSTCGNISSNSALLTVNTLPSITTQPTSLTQCVGTNAFLNIICTGTATINYQWQKEGVDISGETLSSLTIPSISSINEGSYTCIATNSCGSITSSIVQLSVNPSPTITLQPLSLSQCEGTPAIFNITADGINLTYQWQFNGNNISGETNPSLNINSIGSANNGSYSCQVNSSCGNISSNIATLSINYAPTIISQPKGLTLCDGESAIFNVAANGFSPLSYQWSLNGNNISAATNSVYAINSISSSDIGTYTCAVSNVCGIATSNSVTLNGNPPLEFSLFANKDTLCYGDTVRLMFYTTGGNGGPYKVTLPDGKVITPPYYLPVYESDSLTITASDNCASKSFTIPLVVIEAPLAAFTSDITFGCAPLKVQFNESSVNVNQLYSWDFGDDMNNTSSSKNPSHTFKTPGVYDISLTVTSVYGCKTKLVKDDMITVYNVPTSEFTANPMTASIVNPIISFTNNSTDGFHYEWNFGNGALSDDINPEHDYSFSGPGIYDVSLLVISEFGCRDSSIQQIQIKDEFTFYAPTAFSPDNDNINDIFYVLGNGIDPNYFTLLIYDRWGEIIFQTNKYNAENPKTTGWNGNVKGSGIAEVGSYAWTAIYRNTNGSNHQKAGVVTITR